MWHTIYQVAYIGILLSAALWFFLKERNNGTKLAANGFFLSGLAYLLSIVFDQGSILLNLLGLLSPDLAFLMIIVLIFNRLAPKSAGLYFGIFAVIAGLKLFVLDEGREKGIQWIQTQMSGNEHINISHKQELDANGELLVEVKDRTQTAAFFALAKENNWTLTSLAEKVAHLEFSEIDDYYLVNIPTSSADDLSEELELLNSCPDVIYVEYNERMLLEPTPSSSFKAENSVSSLNDPSVDKLWGFQAMGVEKLQEAILSGAIQPKKKAKIAILDTGVESDHEDLEAVFTSIDPSYDRDKLGHGTHCAGIAAAVSNNGKGIASFSPNGDFVELTSIKVLSDEGYGTEYDIIQGIILAADQGASVISLSLGGPSDDSRQKAYEEAITYANKAGAIVVVAAGNSNDNAKYYAPANAKGVITVSALSPDLNRAEFSNYINDLSMGIAAPGVQIYSTYPDNTYQFLNGTSMATPYVAGLIGVMKAVNPELTTEEVYSILSTTGKETGDTGKTGKLIQADKAVMGLQ